MGNLGAMQSALDAFGIPRGAIAANVRIFPNLPGGPKGRLLEMRQHVQGAVDFGCGVVVQQPDPDRAVGFQTERFAQPQGVVVPVPGENTLFGEAFRDGPGL